MTTQLRSFNCPRCGGELKKQSYGVFECPYCNRTWEEECVTWFDAEVKILVSRRYEETQKEYVSNIELKRICNKILDLSPDDFYSRFYLATCKEDAALEEFVATMDIEKHYDNIDEMVEYLIRGLQDRWINAVSMLIEKAYKSNDMEKYNRYRTRFEEIADKVNDGMFDPRIPRDVFIAYSSQDMKKVNELLRILEEENGLSCFVASRNLRHGSGAVENYREAIQIAMRNCKTVVFVSSVNSRNSRCDALKELDYIKVNLPEMRRIELLIEDYKGIASERFFEEFFDGLEYCTSAGEVAKRYFDKSADEAAKRKAEAESKRKAEEEAAARRKAEAEEKRRAEVEAAAKRKAETAKIKAEAEAAKIRAEAEATRLKAKAEAEKHRAAAEAEKRRADAKRQAEEEKAEAKRAAEAQKKEKAKESAKRQAANRAKFGKAIKSFFLVVLRIILLLLPPALIVVSSYLHPILGLWSMVLIGILMGVEAIVMIVLEFEEGEFWGSFVILLIFTVAASVYIFINRETAYVALPFLIMDVVLSIIVAIFIDKKACSYDEERTVILGISAFASGVMLIFAIVWCSSVWGTTPVSIDGPIVKYRLDRSEGTLTAEYYDNRTELAKFDAPNAETVIIENGYKKLLYEAMSPCDSMHTLYIPASVTEIQESAVYECEGLRTVYIGYNADGTPSSEASCLEIIEADAFSSSYVDVFYFNGSTADWENIKKEKNCNRYMGAFKVICTDGTLAYNE